MIRYATAAAFKQAVEARVRSGAIGWLQEELADGDLVILAGLDAARDALARVDGFSEKRFVVAISARDSGPFTPSPRLLPEDLGR